MNNDSALLMMVIGLVGYAIFHNTLIEMNLAEKTLALILLISAILIFGIYYRENHSPRGKEKTKLKEQIADIPDCLKLQSIDGVTLGFEENLKIPLYLPDSIRKRHVHILGATGSGKTESVILNFLKQDVARGYGAIILDAKGDFSFLKELRAWVPGEKLKVFDLGDENSMSYDPLKNGSPLEAAQRLFSSMNWSEEYYKSKAFSALQAAFVQHAKINKRNPTLPELNLYFLSATNFATLMKINSGDKEKDREFADISGLRDQLRSLCIGYLGNILSGMKDPIDITQARNGDVIYFRLQSLLSPQAVKILGRLIINHLNFLAGTAHREQASEAKLVPTYLDEFASFACDEFADLISKARSANLALHFSHQSTGDRVPGLAFI